MSEPGTPTDSPLFDRTVEVGKLFEEYDIQDEYGSNLDIFQGISPHLDTKGENGELRAKIREMVEDIVKCDDLVASERDSLVLKAPSFSANREPWRRRIKTNKKNKFMVELSIRNTVKRSSPARSTRNKKRMKQGSNLKN